MNLAPKLAICAHLPGVFCLSVLLSFGVMLADPPSALADGPGQGELDEAMRIRVNAKDLRDLYTVIEQLEQALDKGLDDENTKFAEQMLSQALLERATLLVRAVTSRPSNDARTQRQQRAAASDLRRVLAYDEPPLEARLMLAQILALPNGDRHEARRQLDAYLESEELDNQQRAKALMLRGRVQTGAAKALADFDQAIALAPDDSALQLTRAVLLRAQKKNAEALEGIESVLEAEPDNAAAVMLMGEILRDEKKYEQALAVFDQMHELVPDQPVPFQQRGEIYRELKEFDRAVEQFSRVIDMEPEALLPRIHRAEAHVQAGKIEEALADVDAILEIRPNFVPAARMKAEIYKSQDDLGKAIAVMQELSRAVPQAPEVSLQLALYYLLNQQPQEAIEAYSQALIVDRNNYAALRGRGDAYLNVGDHRAARDDFERALKIDSEAPDLLNNFAWLLATSPDDEIRDGKRAVELAKKSCEATEYKFAHILSTLAAAYAETGDFNTAREWSQKAVDMNDPDHGEQLVKELESYKQGKPWRERQSLGSAPTAQAEPGPETNSSVEQPQTAETPVAEVNGGN